MSYHQNTKWLVLFVSSHWGCLWASDIGSVFADLVKKLEEENKVNAYMCEEKLPKDVELMRKGCQDLERVVNEPAMGQGDLEEIQQQVQAV